VDGLILAPSTGSRRFLAAQIERGTKVVCVDRPDSGASPDPLLVRHGLRSRPASAAAAELAALSVQSRPTALFTVNDLITMGVIDSGMHTQLALVGFDEFALADKLTPPISIVAQDPDLIGTTAATRLFARINGDITPPRELILRTRFISRGSEGDQPPLILASAVAAVGLSGSDGSSRAW
jgi:DNA-binding LacI/PurR family transcriptional regulator